MPKKEEVYVANGKMKRVIDKLAAKQGTSPEQVVRRSILLMDDLSSRDAAGDTITVREKKSGKTTQISFTSKYTLPAPYKESSACLQ